MHEGERFKCYGQCIKAYTANFNARDVKIDII